MDNTQIWIYRKPRPRSRTGKQRPAIIEIGNGILRPNFYPYNAKNESRVIAVALPMGYRVLRDTARSMLLVRMGV